MLDGDSPSTGSTNSGSVDPPAGIWAWENKSGIFASGPKLTLPVAVTVFPRDIPRLPRSWIEDTYSNLIHYGEADKGGHFAALEQPEILVSEIRTGLRTLRS